jgi:signal transduction histidine kinase
VSLIRGSASRMQALIENVTDFARGRLGGGMRVDVSPQLLEPLLLQVIAELRSASPDRAIETDISLGQPVECDTARIAQLVSNLLSNALKYGAPDRPVTVSACVGNQGLELTIANEGPPVPASQYYQLFQPFVRGRHQPGSEGLGLGLYIVSEIARAHGGTIEVTSDAARTCFIFRMPVARAA